ncbi:hypothetical protein ISU95_06160 [Enterobacter cloacae]|uniref:HEPN family nuclease n=1 Tax=Enterobacter cloacae TaxID=550 RepID=UPI00188BDA37|nr:HEPN family nuclease [Enterobacter cloacae]MBF4156605.1 hypothetical protein [Enterobacter cloacae]HAS0921862.1 hypothetical protein [Enterobacter cloacae]
MTLKDRFDFDDMDPKLEALDLLTSYSCTMQFLEHFQDAIFNKEKQMLSIKDVYIEYLFSLGLINTVDDLPEILTGRRDNPNELQAIRNIKYPRGLGSIAAYMCLNLGVAKEIVADKLPNKNSTKIKSDWFVDEFDIILDEGNKNPSVYRIITRLRNSISHHNFKLRIPDSKLNETDLKDKIEISFYDTDGKSGNDFYARASFKTIEKIIKKIHRTEYTFHNCPVFSYDNLNSENIVKYVESCFIHFSRPYSKQCIEFKGVKMLDPLKAYQLKSASGSFEASHSDVVMYKVCFSRNGKPCNDLYIDIPYFSEDNPKSLIIEDEICSLGEYPMEWILNDIRSPLCRLDKKIRDMIKCIIHERI